MNIKERIAALRGQITANIQTAKDILGETTEDEGGVATMTEEQSKKYEAALAGVDDFKAEIGKLENLMKIEAELIAPKPAETADGQAQGQHIYDGSEELPGDWNFQNLGEYGMAVYAAYNPTNPVVDPRITAGLAAYAADAPTSPHKETGQTEGILVPPDFRTSIWNAVSEIPSILNMIGPQPTNSNSVSAPVDQSTPWGSAGVQAFWGPEAGKFKPSNVDLEPRDVKIHKLHVFVEATEELLEDAPLLSNHLNEKAPLAMNWKASEGIVNGTGAGQPLGWTTSNAPVVVARNTALKVEAEDVTGMWSRLISHGKARSFWMVGTDVVPQLQLMTLGNHSIWTPPATGFQDAPNGFLFGRPIVETEHAEELGTKGDIHLVDPGGYTAYIRSNGIKFDSSIHLFFQYDIQCFRWTMRMGGVPYLDKPIAKAKGSTKLSNFVLLAT